MSSKEEPLLEGYRWVTLMDDRVRPLCAWPADSLIYPDHEWEAAYRLRVRWNPAQVAWWRATYVGRQSASYWAGPWEMDVEVCSYHSDCREAKGHWDILYVRPYYYGQVCDYGRWV